jgi:hypothetical protein
MTKKTKMVLGGVAVLGVAYYLWKKSQDKGMANMSGYSNASGFASTGSTGRQRVCVRMEKDGSTTTYTATGGGRCPYGGTVSN